MNVLRLLLIIGLLYLTAEKGYDYFKLQNMCETSPQDEKQTAELKQARGAFLRILIITAFYIAIKLFLK